MNLVSFAHRWLGRSKKKVHAVIRAGTSKR